MLQISYFDCWKIPYLVIPQYNKLSIYTQGIWTIPHVTRKRKTTDEEKDVLSTSTAYTWIVKRGQKLRRKQVK